MQLSGDDLEDALMAVNVLISTLRRNRIVVPPWVSEVGDRLDMQSAMSSGGHESSSGRAQSEADRFLPSGEAAEILGLSTRHLSRRASDYGGQKHGRYWYFSRDAVLEHAKESRRGAAVRQVRGVPRRPVR